MFTYYIVSTAACYDCYVHYIMVIVEGDFLPKEGWHRIAAMIQADSLPQTKAQTQTHAASAQSTFSVVSDDPRDRDDNCQKQKRN